VLLLAIAFGLSALATAGARGRMAAAQTRLGADR
jgi:hypothetical protein